MAERHGNAGQTARGLARQRDRTRRINALVAAAGMILLLWITLQPRVMLGGSVGLVILVIVFIAMKWLDRTSDATDRHLRKRTRDAVRGAKGEEAIARVLAALPDEYTVFHDLTKLAGDIDHIVVGPTGIFVIETKAHGGRVRADGNQVLVNEHPPEKDFIAQIWRNAFWVRDVLKNTAEIEVAVIPLLVFANAFVSVRGTVKGVRVINKKILVETICRSPRVEFPITQVIEILRQKTASGSPAV